MEGPVKRVLEVIGDKNRYQYMTFGVLFMFNAFVNLLMVGPTLIFMNPLFECQGYDHLVDQSQACSILSSCQIESDFTLVAKMELYCDRQGDRNVVQFMLLVGSFVGSFLINMLAEGHGRKTALMVAMLSGMAGTLSTLLGGEWQQLWLCVLGQFLCGIFAYPMLIQTYIYLYEMCEDGLRQRATVAINYSWCITYSMIGVLYYFYNNWRDYLLYIILIPMTVVFLFSLWYLVEGPNYLFRKNKIEDCKLSLSFIARINGTKKEFMAIEKVLDQVRHQEQRKEGVKVQSEETIVMTIKQLMKNKIYVRMLIILCFTQAGANLHYWGSNYAYDQIGNQFGLNCIVAGIIEALGFFTLNLIIQKLPRRKSLFIMYMAMAAIGFLFLLSAVQDNDIAAIVVLGVIRYIGTIQFMLVIMFMTECFPSNLKSVSTGIIEAVGQVGGVIGPIIINLCINLQIHPMVALSVSLLALAVIPWVWMVDPPEEVAKEYIQASVHEKLIVNQEDSQQAN